MLTDRSVGDEFETGVPLQPRVVLLLDEAGGHIHACGRQRLGDTSSPPGLTRRLRSTCHLPIRPALLKSDAGGGACSPNKSLGAQASLGRAHVTTREMPAYLFLRSFIWTSQSARRQVGGGRRVIGSQRYAMSTLFASHRKFGIIHTRTYGQRKWQARAGTWYVAEKRGFPIAFFKQLDTEDVQAAMSI